MSASKILVVDDEPDVVETVEFCLEQEGYEVFTATNGLEGLGAARAQDPDLIVLDVMMPGENGYRVAQMIREDETTAQRQTPVPIILLTARDLSSDPEREQMFMDFSKANLMMYKPFQMDDLLSRIQELLAN
ncbi:MAG: response regulator transcription factor [Thermoanaerobaculia bacterium]